MSKLLHKSMLDFPYLFSEIDRDNFHCPVGWDDIVYNLTKELHSIYPDLKVVQVKEKFAGLRYYIEPVPPELRNHIYDIIGKAEEEAYTTCMWCGSKEAKQGDIGNWIVTACDKCMEEKQAERKQQDEEWEARKKELMNKVYKTY